MKRHEAIEAITGALGSRDLVVSSTGMTSRELFTIKDSDSNFYMIGSIGLASAIGLGLALCLPAKRIVVIDGDGSALMGMGATAIIGHYSPANLVHIVLDNEACDSTGGQQAVAATARLDEVAAAVGYRVSSRVAAVAELRKVLGDALEAGPALIVAKIEDGALPEVGRVSHTPPEIANRLGESAIGR